MVTRIKIRGTLTLSDGVWVGKDVGSVFGLGVSTSLGNSDGTSDIDGDQDG